jgi:hypothetical protein
MPRDRRDVLATVITGFNTDIEHDGVVYHVQTEDKGLDTPIILSLVYSGGTILASKRSPYKDLIAEGFTDEALAERLKRQHRLICAAIHSGRLDDLKKMSRPSKATAPQTEQSVEATVAEAPVAEKAVAEEAVPQAAVAGDIIIEEEPELDVSQLPLVEEFEFEYGPITQEWTPPPPRVEEEPPAEEHGVAEDEAASQVGEEGETAEPEFEEPLPDGLVITMLDQEEFYSGERYILRVLISNRLAGDETPLPNSAVSIKILGTTFRPLIYTLKTERDGVATVATQIPEFTSGRAAVLVRAVVKDQAAELRRIIHPRTEAY